MAVNPSLKHIRTSEFNHVYAPSDDTWLLIDALQADLPVIRKAQPSVVVEVGVGSGAVLTSLAMTLGQGWYVGIDINPQAVCMAERTLAANSVSNYEVVQGRYLTGLRKVDIVISNPPYVVTSDQEFNEGQAIGGISASWAGGQNGRRFIDAFIQEAKSSMSPDGLLYLLVEERNKPSELGGKIVLSRQIVGESLQVLRLHRSEL